MTKSSTAEFRVIAGGLEKGEDPVEGASGAKTLSAWLMYKLMVNA